MNTLLNCERIPDGLVNLYTIKIEDRYGFDEITFSSNMNYDYEELRECIEDLAFRSEDADELIDNIKIKLGFWYTEEHNPISVKIQDHDAIYCPYCGSSISGFTEDACAECDSCNSKFSTKYKGQLKKIELDNKKLTDEFLAENEIDRVYINTSNGRLYITSEGFKTITPYNVAFKLYACDDNTEDSDYVISYEDFISNFEEITDHMYAHLKQDEGDNEMTGIEKFLCDVINEGLDAMDEGTGIEEVSLTEENEVAVYMVYGDVFKFKLVEHVVCFADKEDVIRRF